MFKKERVWSWMELNHRLNVYIMRFVGINSKSPYYFNQYTSEGRHTPFPVFLHLSLTLKCWAFKQRGVKYHFGVFGMTLLRCWTHNLANRSRMLYLYATVAIPFRENRIGKKPKNRLWKLPANLTCKRSGIIIINFSPLSIYQKVKKSTYHWQRKV